MDVLKRELQCKRQLLDADFGGRKLLHRSEIQRVELQRLRDAERRRLQQKLQFHPTTPSSASPSTVTDSHEIQGDHPSDTKESLPREEVIWRLWLLQPATLFGEGDAARLRRLHAVIEDPAAVADVDASEIARSGRGRPTTSSETSRRSGRRRRRRQRSRRRWEPRRTGRRRRQHSRSSATRPPTLHRRRLGALGPEPLPRPPLRLRSLGWLAH